MVNGLSDQKVRGNPGERDFSAVVGEAESDGSGAGNEREVRSQGW